MEAVCARALAPCPGTEGLGRGFLRERSLDSLHMSQEAGAVCGQACYRNQNQGKLVTLRKSDDLVP